MSPTAYTRDRRRPAIPPAALTRAAAASQYTRWTVGLSDEVSMPNAATAPRPTRMTPTVMVVGVTPTSDAVSVTPGGTGMPVTNGRSRNATGLLSWSVACAGTVVAVGPGDAEDIGEPRTSGTDSPATSTAAMTPTITVYVWSRP